MKRKVVGIRIGDKVIECQPETTLEFENTATLSEPRKLSDLSYKEALVVLGIIEYSERIWNASPTGELHYISDYQQLALLIKDDDSLRAYFKEWFNWMITNNPDKENEFFVSMSSQWVKHINLVCGNPQT